MVGIIAQVGDAIDDHERRTILLDSQCTRHQALGRVYFAQVEDFKQSGIRVKNTPHAAFDASCPASALLRVNPQHTARLGIGTDEIVGTWAGARTQVFGHQQQAAECLACTRHTDDDREVLQSHHGRFFTAGIQDGHLVAVIVVHFLRRDAPSIKDVLYSAGNKLPSDDL